MFEGRAHTAMNSAIVYLAVCVSDVMIKTGTCARSVCYVMNQALCALH